MLPIMPVTSVPCCHFFQAVHLGFQVSFAGSENSPSDRVSPRPTLTTWPNQLLSVQWLFYLNLWLPSEIDYKLPEGRESISSTCALQFLFKGGLCGFFLDTFRSKLSHTGIFIGVSWPKDWVTSNRRQQRPHRVHQACIECLLYSRPEHTEVSSTDITRAFSELTV